MTIRTYSCKDCSAEFTHDKPNRPPVRCETCREKRKPSGDNIVQVKEKLTGVEWVDRLELMLLANNTHISQHRKEWE